MCISITPKIKFILICIGVVFAIIIGIIVYFSAPVQATIKTVKVAVKAVKTVRKALKRRRNKPRDSRSIKYLLNLFR